MSLRTALARVRGLGSAKNGAEHWWMERISSIALVPLTLWFVNLVIQLTSKAGSAHLLASPVHTIGLILFLGVAIYHGMLGMKVIIEDYVHKECAKVLMIILIKFVCIGTIVAVTCALLVFHLMFFTSTI